MKFSVYEKALLNGDLGEEAQMLMEVMLKILEINRSKGLVEVKHVLIGNTGMLSVAGETGIGFLERLANSGVKFKVPVYTNVISMDTERWREMNMAGEYAENQLRTIKAWKKLGAILNCSCMPFYCGAIPRYRDHVAYADTAPVIFANSVLGARSNREPDPICLSAAICGRVPNFGYHLEEERMGRVLVEVTAPLNKASDFDVLGLYVGKIVKDKVPVFKARRRDISQQALVQLGAAMATSGEVALFHWFDVTPEIQQDPYTYGEKNIIETIEVTHENIKQIYRELNSQVGSEIDLVFIGCPHCSIEKIKEIAEKLQGKRIDKELEIWIAASNTVRHLAEKSGYLDMIENSGAKVIADTCAVIAPTEALGYRKVVTDSSKAWVYLSDFGLQVGFGSTDDCLDAAVKGYWATDEN